MPLRNSMKVPLSRTRTQPIVSGHTYGKIEKRHAPLEWYIEIGDVMQHEVDKGFVSLFSEEVDE